MDAESVTATNRRNSARGCVRDLSARLATHFGVRHALLVDHGSTALRAALWAVRSRTPNKRLTVGAPCNVWRGVYSAIGFSGSQRLVLLDVDPEMGVVDPELALGDCDVVVAVDGYSVRSPVAALRAAGSAVIEDASLSQSPSMDAEGKLVADVCIISLQSNKLLSCGEGGLVLTDSQDLAEAVECSVCDGRRWMDELDDAPVLMGFNGMMPEFSAQRLEEALAGHAQYLRRVADGVAAIHRLVGAHSAVAWADEDLLRSGKVFAVPISRQRVHHLLDAGLQVGGPPPPPDAHLWHLLSQLPLDIQLNRDFSGAKAFADEYALSPHWDLALLGDSDD